MGGENVFTVASRSRKAARQSEKTPTRPSLLDTLRESRDHSASHQERGFSDEGRSGTPADKDEDEDDDEEDEEDDDDDDGSENDEDNSANNNSDDGGGPSNSNSDPGHRNRLLDIGYSKFVNNLKRTPQKASTSKRESSDRTDRGRQAKSNPIRNIVERLGLRSPLKNRSKDRSAKRRREEEDEDEVTSTEVLIALLGAVQNLQDDFRAHTRNCRSGSSISASDNPSQQSDDSHSLTQYINDDYVLAETAAEYTKNTGIKLHASCLFTIGEAREAYAKFKGKAMKPSQNVPIAFVIRDEHGKQISAERLTLIREMVRAMIAELEGLEDKRKPSKTGKMKSRSKNYYNDQYRQQFMEIIKKLEKQIPELRYCRGHWKALAVVDRRLKTLSSKDLLTAKTEQEPDTIPSVAAASPATTTATSSRTTNSSSSTDVPSATAANSTEPSRQTQKRKAAGWQALQNKLLQSPGTRSEGSNAEGDANEGSSQSNANTQIWSTEGQGSTIGTEGSGSQLPGRTDHRYGPGIINSGHGHLPPITSQHLPPVSYGHQSPAQYQNMGYGFNLDNNASHNSGAIYGQGQNHFHGKGQTHSQPPTGIQSQLYNFPYNVHHTPGHMPPPPVSSLQFEDILARADLSANVSDTPTPCLPLEPQYNRTTFGLNIWTELSCPIPFYGKWSTICIPAPALIGDTTHQSSTSLPPNLQLLFTHHNPPFGFLLYAPP
ncbi:hypothetical protein CF326_g5483 [Tilletia indica]|nr:hypothetical protein CF326_g5483 [Tilletia indica]